MNAVVSLRGVVKRYGSVEALGGIDLDVRRGEILGLLGPNGAGKTTLIGIVAGNVRATAGTITVLGKDVVRDYRETRRVVGLVPQEINFDPFFTVEESLRIQAGYFGVRLTEERLVEILDALDLAGKRKAMTRTLSGGMKRRLLIGKALVHDPRVLFLDEPTAGVDVELRQALWRYVRTLRGRGTTIVLTTHYLEEAEELADRIGVLDRPRRGRAHAGVIGRVERALDRRQAPRRRCDPGHGHTRALDPAVRRGDDRRRRNQRVGQVPAVEVQPRRTRPRRGHRHGHSGDELVARQRRLVGGDEQLVDRDVAGPARTGSVDGGLECKQRGRQRARGVRVREPAADCHSMTQRRIGDRARAHREQRKPVTQELRGFDVPDAGHGADPDGVAVVADAGQLVDLVEVDHAGGSHGPLVEQDCQAAPTREQHGLGRVRRQSIYRLIDGPRSVPRERDRGHRVDHAGMPV
jgi:ABC-type Na+ transport system ATPase subunit NatA